ncbi:MAG: bifunctional 23S rRNA (guanine(2069)-N(7))-methyltransferase RlmK/23S rRNA (guanine(2445)-N(2))-methyltransferase RlmL [Candidatus Symbiodolus clandestinus]
MSEYTHYELFARTARGLEELLKQELQTFGAEITQMTSSGVHFKGSLPTIYQSLLWSRLASRMLLKLAQFPVLDEQQLYQGALAIDWPAYFASNATFAVRFIGTSAAIRHSHYGALRIKDAIIDRFQQQQRPRPVVATHQPDLLIEGCLQRDQLMLSLDLSGESLHRRGYRQQAGVAPIKETLAAAMIRRSGWQPGEPFIDPMCGAGTLLIEAALVATDRAPGLQRSRWGVAGWFAHQPQQWQALQQQAQQRAEDGKQRYQGLFLGYDQTAAVLQQARQNAKRAGVAELITFAQADASQLINPVPSATSGTLLTNPPYGERLGSTASLLALYGRFASNLKQQFPGWRLSLLTQHPELFQALNLRAERQFTLYNGPLCCTQKNYQLTQPTREPLNPAGDFTNRLTKKQRQLAPWAEQEGIDSYRLYDADLPDYNVAIDRYADYLVIQEYQPPIPIEERKRQHRLQAVIEASCQVTQLPVNHIIVKQRQRQRHGNQYQPLAQQGLWIAVQEYGAQLWVNLTDYLDSGLFLDHRRTRRLLAKQAAGKDFLNLFCYTAAATVQVARAGARSTTSVDLSTTYLNWAERNLKANDLLGTQHRLIQADCLRWLSDCSQQFDLILLDPPTFSRSKRMQQSFEVQRDQKLLFTQLQRLLRPHGVLLFSNNYREFQLDTACLSVLQLDAKEISHQTTSPDFSRTRSGHRCWTIRRQALYNE